MKHNLTPYLIAVLLLGMISANTVSATANNKLDAKLAFLAPYLGTWEAVFKSEKGKPTIVDVSRWERALNGKAIRTLHSINDGDYGGESLIFWDKKQEKLVFYYFTTADFFTQGEIEVLTDNSFVAYENVSGNEKGITKVRSTSTLEEDKMTVSTAYYIKGAWSEPEKRIYVRSSKTVVFK